MPIPTTNLASLLLQTARRLPDHPAFIRDGVRIIGVNALHHPNRQRFSIAHELCHLLYDGGERDLMAVVSRPEEQLE